MCWLIAYINIMYYYDIVSACELVDLLSNQRRKQVLVQNTDPSNDPFLFFHLKSLFTILFF